MKIIYNKRFPPKGYAAINICGVIFARHEQKPLSDRTRRHEAIHTRQIIELLVIGFYVWYGIEWLIRLAQYRNRKDAYRNISLEREAYGNDKKESYLESRRLFAFVGYLNAK